MMNSKENELGKIYSKIADNLNISQTMSEKAIQSYNSVGKWLGEGLDYDVSIFPQGSFSLGTVIKPLSDEDDGYDIDLVCLLRDGQYLEAKDIKHLIGNRLLENKLYLNRVDTEGKRCWTLSYDGFHMDILPCVPKYSFYDSPNFSEIRLTHKDEDNIYTDRISNPEKYQIWFEEQMKASLLEAREVFAKSNNVDISEVPTYKMKTPLQKAVQLLKRHRDIMFKEKDDAPISIIITTLAALSYNHDSNVYTTLKNILLNMSKHIIKTSEGKYIIENPVMSQENFADKWNENSIKAKNFYEWLEQAKVDILENPLSVLGKDIGEKVSIAFGKSMTEKAYKDIGEELRILRENNNAYIDGLKGGIVTTASAGTTKIGGHTFFGS